MLVSLFWSVHSISRPFSWRRAAGRPLPAPHSLLPSSLAPSLTQITLHKSTRSRLKRGETRDDDTRHVRFKISFANLEKVGVTEHVELARYFHQVSKDGLAMALVGTAAGGMGEAVLGYGGDGIAPEVVKQAKDGGVFAGLEGDGLGALAKEFLGGGGRPREGGEGRRGCVRVQETLVQQTRNLVNVRLESDIISKAARLASSDGSFGESVEVGERGVVEGVSVGSSERDDEGHASDSEAQDQLVEMAIQCLDEKVIQ